MRKSATARIAVLLVLVLFAVLGSVMPPATLAVAVFVKLPVAEPLTIPLIVISKLAPAGKLAIVPLTVLPETAILAGHSAPPVVVPQLAVIALMLPGSTSLKLVPLAALGPAFEINNV